MAGYVTVSDDGLEWSKLQPGPGKTAAGFDEHDAAALIATTRSAVGLHASENVNVFRGGAAIHRPSRPKNLRLSRHRTGRPAPDRRWNQGPDHVARMGNITDATPQESWLTVGECLPRTADRRYPLGRIICRGLIVWPKPACRRYRGLKMAVCSWPTSARPPNSRQETSRRPMDAAIDAHCLQDYRFSRWARPPRFSFIVSRPTRQTAPQEPQPCRRTTL